MILAHLNLRAVLPAMEDLAVYSQEARELVKDWNFSLRMGILGRVRKEIIFGRGGVSLDVWYFSAAQVNRMFEGKFVWPVLTGNLFQVGKLNKIQKLSKILENYLRPSEAALKDEKFLRAHAAMMLGVLARGAAVMRELDEKARSIFLPDGVAVFEVEGTDAACCLKILEGKIIFENGESYPKPDVRITFCDPMALVEASRQKLDSLAAVGLGRVKIFGLAPMADALELIMDRIGVYLKV